MTGNDGQARAPVTGEPWARVRDGEVALAGTGDRRIRGSSRPAEMMRADSGQRGAGVPQSTATASKPPVPASTTLR